MDHWPDVSESFADLMDLPQSERVRELEKISLRNSEVAREVASLLQAHDAAEGNFQTQVSRMFNSLASEILAKDPVPRFEPGQRLMHFEILRWLGSGSVASVYLAEDLVLERKVALKICLKRNFEARTLAHFSVDGIVQVYSDHAHCEEGLPLRVLCLQFVAGPTLAQLAKEIRQSSATTSFTLLIEKFPQDQAVLETKALKWRESLAALALAEALVLLVMRLSEILSHAHDRGVLHLDIKPENILIDPYGRPFLSDFNVSTFSDRLKMTEPGDLGGTPGYMAPEQARLFCSESRQSALQELDARCDVYALALVLSELLRDANFTDPDLQEVLKQATAPDRTLRTATARQFSQDLGAWLRRRMVEQEMPPLWRGFKWIRQHPLAALFSFSLASQCLASFINIAYNHLQIVAKLSAKQNQVFFKSVALYNVAVYPVALLFLAFVFAPLIRNVQSPHLARRSALRAPLALLAVTSLGWIPGIVIFPAAIDYFAGPVPSWVYQQFAISCGLAWLISMTTTLAMGIFILARALYPKYWPGQQFTARSELLLSQRINRALPLLGALVPMAGAVLAVLTPSSEFRLLVLLIMGFGIANLLLIQSLVQASQRVFSAYKRSRTFD